MTEPDSAETVLGLVATILVLAGLRFVRAAGFDETGKACRKTSEGRAIDLINRAGALRAIDHQTRINQNLQMLRHRRLRQIEALDDLLAATGRMTRQMLQDA